MKLIPSSVSLSRRTVELIYSIALLILIPGLIVINTLVLSNGVQDDYDNQLRKKADLVNQVFGRTAVTVSDNKELLKEIVEDIDQSQSEVSSISLFVPEKEHFDLVATSNSTMLTERVDSMQMQLVKDRKQPVAQLINRSEDGSNRSWHVISPILNGSNEIIALSALDISLEEADALLGATLRQSLLVLLVTVVVVTLLLINHSRFVGYAQVTQKLQEADQMKSDFLSVATHELKSPMSAIKGHVSNILDGTFGAINEQTRASLATVMAQTERLNNLVQDLLDVSRIEQGRVQYDLRGVDVVGVVEPIVSQYEPSAKEKGLEINYQKPTATMQVKADPGRLQEIVANLIDNAVKYTKEGSVSVRHEVAGNKIRTRVKDTGVGMNATERERLFQRFYRVRNDRTRDISGTGLGLWIIKQYVEHMGGSISVDSIEGEGSEFIVELPKAL